MGTGCHGEVTARAAAASGMGDSRGGGALGGVRPPPECSDAPAPPRSPRSDTVFPRHCFAGDCPWGDTSSRGLSGGGGAPLSLSSGGGCVSGLWGGQTPPHPPRGRGSRGGGQGRVKARALPGCSRSLNPPPDQPAPPPPRPQSCGRWGDGGSLHVPPPREVPAVSGGSAPSLCPPSPRASPGVQTPPQPLHPHLSSPPRCTAEPGGGGRGGAAASGGRWVWGCPSLSPPHLTGPLCGNSNPRACTRPG